MILIIFLPNLFRWREIFLTFELYGVSRLTIIAYLWSHASVRLGIVFYDSNFRRAGLESRIRDRREKGELPCRYLQGGREYSSWFIGDVNPWQNEGCEEGLRRKDELRDRNGKRGNSNGDGRAKWGGRLVRDSEEGGRRQEIFYRRTGFLFALATERDHYEDPLGKRFTTVSANVYC